MGRFYRGEYSSPEPQGQPFTHVAVHSLACYTVYAKMPPMKAFFVAIEKSITKSCIYINFSKSVTEVCIKISKGK
jgi:hypothetical protein